MRTEIISLRTAIYEQIPPNTTNEIHSTWIINEIHLNQLADAFSICFSADLFNSQFNSVRYFSTLKKINMFKNISNNNNNMKKKINFHFKCCNNFCHSLTIIKDWPFFLISLSLSFYWPTGFYRCCCCILYTTLWSFPSFYALCF